MGRGEGVKEGKYQSRGGEGDIAAEGLAKRDVHYPPLICGKEEKERRPNF